MELIKPPGSSWRQPSTPALRAHGMREFQPAQLTSIYPAWFGSRKGTAKRPIGAMPAALPLSLEWAGGGRWAGHWRSRCIRPAWWLSRRWADGLKSEERCLSVSNEGGHDPTRAIRRGSRLEAPGDGGHDRRGPRPLLLPATAMTGICQSPCKGSWTLTTKRVSQSLPSGAAGGPGRAGADLIGPSDMDGWPGRSDPRSAPIECRRFQKQWAIISYTAKYASAYYGPSAKALDSAPRPTSSKPIPTRQNPPTVRTRPTAAKP